MMTTAICPLCVLLLWALLCHGRGNGVQEEIFTRPGSDLLIPIRTHLTLNHPENCDQCEWKYKNSTTQADTRIFIHKGCILKKSEDILFSNMNISVNGSLIISNVTLRNDGIYSVDIHNSTGDNIQKAYYTVHVEVPVSVLDLNTTCLQNGSVEVFCEVKEGTKPNISLIVIGGSQKNDFASANNITAIAEPPGPWNITCTVKNRLNQSEISRPGVTCPAPLANITVNSTCHLNGSAEAECSVKGSDPRYSWYLNGDLKSSESRVTLQPPVSGTLRCNVSNQISNLTASINISCAVPVSDPVLDMRCLPNGSAEISCEVKEGTDPSIYLTVSRESVEYNVTSSERTVRVTVVLVPSPDSWNINCSAKNNISKRFTNETRDTCPDTSSCFICLKNSLIWSSAALLLTMSLTFIHHCYLLRGMKKKS